jgi:PIN domain nuclease of toxin-antitoxin system
MKLVLDTHTLVWWSQEPALLGAEAARAVARADQLVVPSICFWEVALLVRKHRLVLKRGQPVHEWAAEVLEIHRVHAEPLTPELAIAADALEMHADPADRFIVATAMAYRASIVTKDGLLASLPGVKTIW